ncbi:FRG domain-containing protein [Vibrio cholerae]|nr:FRG domain-containing protein [Vibrio cholerae]
MYELKRYRTVRNFLDSISPINEKFASPFREYIFRGQGNSNWRLIPSIFRPNTKIPHGTTIQRGPKASLGEQRKMEWELLSDFVIEANSNGFHLPDENTIYKILDKRFSDKEVTKILRHETVWPDSQYLSLLSLAQHYGLPTRLLDWSYSSYVAAYFAAKQCIADIESGIKVKSLSVYALNAKWTEFKSVTEIPDVQEEIYKNQKRTIEFQVVKPPTYFNAHLKAQKGVFTCQHEFGNIKHLANIDVCLKEFVLLIQQSEQEELQRNNFLRSISNVISSVNGTVLYEFTLPATKASELLICLDKLGVNSSTLFPSLGGCVETLFDRTKVS